MRQKIFKIRSPWHLVPTCVIQYRQYATVRGSTKGFKFGRTNSLRHSRRCFASVRHADYLSYEQARGSVSGSSLSPGAADTAFLKETSPFWVRSPLATPCLRLMAAPHHNVNSQERLRERPDSTRSWQHVTTRGAERNERSVAAPPPAPLKAGTSSPEPPKDWLRSKPLTLGPARARNTTFAVSRRCTGGKRREKFEVPPG